MYELRGLASEPILNDGSCCSGYPGSVDPAECQPRIRLDLLGVAHFDETDLVGQPDLDESNDCDASIETIRDRALFPASSPHPTVRAAQV